MEPPKDFGLNTAIQTPRGETAVLAFAGWDKKYIRPDGTLSPSWEQDSIVRVPVPTMKYVLGSVNITKVACHNKIAVPVRDAFRIIGARGLLPALGPYAGGYAPRLVRGGSKPSCHFFGLAFDFDPSNNQYHAPIERSRIYSTPEGREAIYVFESYGFYWGGRFKLNPDAQHFQFATEY